MRKSSLVPLTLFSLLAIMAASGAGNGILADIYVVDSDAPIKVHHLLLGATPPAAPLW